MKNKLSLSSEQCGVVLAQGTLASGVGLWLGRMGFLWQSVKTNLVNCGCMYLKMGDRKEMVLVRPSSLVSLLCGCSQRVLAACCWFSGVMKGTSTLILFLFSFFFSLFSKTNFLWFWWGCLLFLTLHCTEWRSQFCFQSLCN